MNNSSSRKIIAFNGSPVMKSNTDLITREILAGAEQEGYKSEHVYLNRMAIMPCQSCGESPGEKLCFYQDDLFPFLHTLSQSEIVVVSSPIYFDSISAQTKLFVDRCNCFKPLVGYESGNFRFEPVKHKRKLGVIVLVGGEREKFVHALTVLKGLFIWAGIEFFDQLLYAHSDYGLGAVKDDPETLSKARTLGTSVASSRCKLK
ncbi:MAG: hypothetical protein GF404_08060 [candidate division Zixibacteria bacterium]|nr:hypothetical protein [candidate division Zixibacteria bacterium]